MLMKPFSRSLLIVLLAIVMAIPLALGASAEADTSLPVLFIKDGGKGDGSSADSPLSTVNYFINKNASSPSYHYNSVLYQALHRLSATGGTIVVCGEVKIHSENTSGTSKNVRDFFAPEHPDTCITLTSVWDGVDYREQGARFVLQHPANFYSGGDLVFRDIDICTMPSENGSANDRIIAAYGYDLTFDEGVACIPLDANGKVIAKPTSSQYPNIVGGHRFTNVYRSGMDPFAVLTIKSGTFNRVNASSWGISVQGDYNEFKSDVHVILDGDAVIEGEINGTSHLAYAKHMGNVTVTINGGKVKGSIVAAGECGYAAPNCTFRLEINGGEISSPLMTGKASSLASDNVKRYNPTSILDLSGCPAELGAKMARKGRNFTNVIPPLAAVTGGSIRSEAVKTAYFEGDAFDGTGLNVKLNTSDDGFSLSYSPDNKAFRFEPAILAADTAEVKVFYGNHEIGTVAVTVSPRPQIAMKGAMIRLEGEKQALRFVASLGNAPESTEIVRYGMIINSADYFTEISLEQPGATILDLTDTVYQTNEDGILFTGSITDIPVEEYDLAYTAAAFLTFQSDGKEYTAYSSPITRSVKSVAEAVCSADSRETISGIKAVAAGVIEAVESGRRSTPVQSDIDAMVNHLHQNMVDMASVKWKSNATLDFASNTEYTGQLQYTKGTVYTGIPYVAGNAGYVGLDQWTEAYPDGSTYTGSTEWNKMWGNQCISSVINALQPVTASQHFADGLSFHDFFPKNGSDNYIAVGDYSVPGTAISTEEVIESLGTNDRERANIVFEAYAQAKSGDFIVSNWRSSKGSLLCHIRIVDEVHVVRNTNGSINAAKSYLLATEQCSTMDKTTKTTWRINYKYTFNELCNFNNVSSKYLPVRLSAFASGYRETPLLGILDRNTKDNIEHGLSGRILSNYQITAVHLTIKDAQDKVALSFVEYPYTVNSVDLRTFDLSNEVSKLKKGNYHYELQVSYAGKTETVLSFDFKK
ncbi:MAG: hypothetical protein E7655_00505 [Ruminococcaceae bacterium]|nr:hypothetical protein [Oscillospiraceae bacterium]